MRLARYSVQIVMLMSMVAAQHAKPCKIGTNMHTGARWHGGSRKVWYDK
ncbi:MAG: hypothetical protein NUV74_05180 [Candidatus Brocadiaceae bacterium]|nr:hypothetical protein [Candidatus Brocadiaceae bacterium]